MHEQPVPAEEPVYQNLPSRRNPQTPLKESDQLKEAYDRLQRDIEAAKPQEVDLVTAKTS